MISTVVRFVLILTVLMGAAFGVHSYVQDAFGIGSFEHLIIFNYIFNYSIAIITLVILIRFNQKKSNKLGYIFMYSSMTKFVLFLIFIKPEVDVEQGINGVKFLAFFVPYGLSTITEIVYLVRMLNARD